MAENGAIVEDGKVILAGRYRIVRLLYRRPRLHLYLGRRLTVQGGEVADGRERMEPLVAIRELVLDGLAPSMRARIEAAAFEEFVSPVVPGSAHMPLDGDRVWVDGERHYLVKQLDDQKRGQQGSVLTLDELLWSQREWPAWLSTKTALKWSAQLGRIVARLHHLHMLAGYLDPSAVLVSDVEDSPWSPTLLPSWPPPLAFWRESLPDAAILCRQIFPIGESLMNDAFIAPEMLFGEYDERSDVYTLGAILYLLLTRYAPSAAILRLQTAQNSYGKESRARLSRLIEPDEGAGLDLIAPHRLYHLVSQAQEQIVLRALELDPEQRYPSVFALVEALEDSIG